MLIVHHFRHRVGLLMLVTFVCATLATSHHATRAQPPDPNSNDQLIAMQGVWYSTDSSGETRWTFKGNLLEVDSPTRNYKFRITLDAQAKPHKHFDFEALEDSPNSPGAKSLGIYKFDGPQKLFICFAVPCASRPKAFANDMFETFVFELSRRPD